MTDSDQTRAIRRKINIGLAATIVVAVGVALQAILVLQGVIVHRRVIFALEALDGFLILGVGVVAVILSRSLLRLYEQSATDLANLQRSRALTKKVIENAMDCIISINDDGKIIEFNPAAEKTFGYSRDEVIGKEMASVIVPVHLRDAHRKGLAHYLATGEGPVMNKRIEMPALGRGGNIFSVELSIIRTQVDGTPIFTGFLRDITDRKLWEAEKNKAIQARDELIGVVSHELKNPLTAIGTSISLMLRSGEPGDRALLKKTATNIEASVHRMNRLVSDLLDVTRIEAGHLKLESSDVAAIDLVKEAVDAFRPLAAERAIRLEYIVPPGCSAVHCDKDRIAQVLSNLIGNAVKFTPSGGAIQVRAEPVGAEVQFEVRDSGTGIAEDQLPNVFNRFWQAKQFAYRGVGLGLSIAKGLIEAQGGRIWVESKPGVGSKFIFTLPEVKAGRKPTVRTA